MPCDIFLPPCATGSFMLLHTSPQYYEIYKHRAVIGISVTFIAVDMLGGIFSDLSLAFKEEFDVLASITYSLVVVSTVLKPKVL